MDSLWSCDTLTCTCKNSGPIYKMTAVKKKKKPMVSSQVERKR